MGFEPCRHHTTLALAAAAALAFTTAPSMAASASASLTNISLSVVDLDLTDGIEPGFSFIPGRSFLTGQLLVARSPEQLDHQTFGQSGLDSPFISGSASASIIGARMNAAATPNSLTMSGSTSAPASFNGGALFQAFVQLTPNTRLIAGADYSVSAEAIDACGLPRPLLSCEASRSTVDILFSEPVSAAQAFAESQALLGGGVDSTGPRSGSLQALFDNSFDSALDLSVGFQTTVVGIGAIPEPETYALMLVGLGALGLISRRRNRRAAS